MSRNIKAVLIAACSIVLITGATFAGSAATLTSRVPSTLNRSLVKVTHKGSFEVRIASADQPIPLHKIHHWSVEVTDRSGHQVTGATFKVAGGMPQHGHGLPTAPIVRPTGVSGRYDLQGMKFSMTGWWELTLQVSAGGVTEQVTFNIVL
jgi:hypothetical protein